MELMSQLRVVVWATPPQTLLEADTTMYYVLWFKRQAMACPQLPGFWRRFFVLARPA